MLHRKNQLVRVYRLRGLRQARKLLAKVTALSDQKHLLMTIASGKASRVDRLISLGLCQKGGPWVVGFIFGSGRWILQPKECYGGGRYESVAPLETGGKSGGRDQSSSEQCTERLISTVLIFDEIATEKRICWDPQDELLSRIIQGAFVDEGNENVCLTAEHQVGQVGYHLEH